MRWSLWLVVVIGCSDTEMMAPPIPLEIRGACAFPLADDGAVVFPDTALAVQRSLRPIDVIYSGTFDIVTYDLVWTVEGLDAADFQILLRLSDFEACGDYLHEKGLHPGDYCTLGVQFAPMSLGPKQATLHVRFPGYPDPGYQGPIDQTFELLGSAVAAPTTVFTSVTDHYVPLNESSSPMIAITNRSTADVDLGEPSITGPFGPRTPYWDCPATLPPGGSCNAMVSADHAGAHDCPIGAFTTSTAAFTVPLTARLDP